MPALAANLERFRILRQLLDELRRQVLGESGLDVAPVFAFVFPLLQYRQQRRKNKRQSRRNIVDDNAGAGGQHNRPAPEREKNQRFEQKLSADALAAPDYQLTQRRQQ